MKQLTLLNIFHIIIDGLYGSVPILLSFMVLSFGSEEKEAGLILSLVNATVTLAGLTAIFFSRHLGLYRTISLITLFYGVGFCVNAFSRDIYFSGFCFVLATAGFGVFHNATFSYLTANSEKGSLGKTLGDFTAIGDIGRIPLTSLAGFIAAFSIAGFSGWRIVCLAYGLGALLCAARLSLFSFRERQGFRRENPPHPGTGKVFPSFRLLRDRRYALPIVAGVLDAFGSNQVFAFLPFLLFAKGFDPKIIGPLAFAFTSGCLLGKAALGRMVDKYGNRKIFAATEATMSALLGFLTWGSHPVVIVGTAFLLGIVTKGTVPVIQTIITGPVQKKHEYDDIFAIHSFSCGIANMISPLLFGFIASSAGINWSFALMAIAASCAVIPVLLMSQDACPAP